MSKKPVMLMILDGWGVAPASEVNAATLAQTPNLDRYFAEFPILLWKLAVQKLACPKDKLVTLKLGI